MVCLSSWGLPSLLFTAYFLSNLYRSPHLSEEITPQGFLGCSVIMEVTGHLRENRLKAGYLPMDRDKDQAWGLSRSMERKAYVLIMKSWGWLERGSQRHKIAWSAHVKELTASTQMLEHAVTTHTLKHRISALSSKFYVMTGHWTMKWSNCTFLLIITSAYFVLKQNAFRVRSQQRND